MRRCAPLGKGYIWEIPDQGLQMRAFGFGEETEI